MVLSLNIIRNNLDFKFFVLPLGCLIYFKRENSIMCCMYFSRGGAPGAFLKYVRIT